MGQMIAFAEGIAGLLKDAGVRATVDVRQAVPPCVLVVPVARLEADILCGGWSATFTIVCLASGMGDLTDARVLEELLDQVVEHVPAITTVEPSAYQLPTTQEPKPALLCTFTAVVTPQEE